MQKQELIYEGKAKKLFTCEDESLLIAQFKDDLTAFNAQKKSSELGKGSLNNKISTLIFELLSKKGIKTHLVETIDDTHQIIKKCQIIPLEVIVRNITAGSFSKKFGVAEGKELPSPIVEFCLKDDELEDPMMCKSHILALDLASNEELDFIKKTTLEINEIMKDFFKAANIILVDFKIEFGRLNNEIILADEISPDSCRLWDATTKEKLDKDRFRRDLGDVVSAYKDVLSRITGAK